MHLRAIVAAAILATCAGPARASDFWDEVRHPGRTAARGLARAARHALAAGDGAAALRLARRAVANAPEDAAAQVLLGRALATMSHYAHAAAAFEHALGLSTGALDTATDGAPATTAALRAGRYDLAAVILARLIAQLGPSQARRRLLRMRGDTLMALGPRQLNAALAAYRFAMRDPGGDPIEDATLRLGLALALHRAGQAAEADNLLRHGGRVGRVDDLLARLPLPPTERAARRAVVQAALGHERRAARAWATALGTGPWRPAAPTQPDPAEAIGRTTNQTVSPAPARADGMRRAHGADGR